MNIFLNNDEYYKLLKNHTQIFYVAAETNMKHAYSNNTWFYIKLKELSWGSFYFHVLYLANNAYLFTISWGAMIDTFRPNTFMVKYKIKQAH